MTEPPKPRGLTRRGLFRSIGTATIVAGCVKQEAQPEAPDVGSPAASGLDGAFGLDPAPLEFVLDGTSVKREVEARTTLLELLRLDLDSTGSKLANYSMEVSSQFGISRRRIYPLLNMY